MFVEMAVGMMIRQLPILLSSILHSIGCIISYTVTMVDFWFYQFLGDGVGSVPAERVGQRDVTLG